MDDAPPPPYRVRRPTDEDIPEVFELIAACDTAVLGAPDVTLDDVRDDFAQPGFDPTLDAWVVRHADGSVTGYASVLARGSSSKVHGQSYVRPGADLQLGAWLLGRVERRAVEIGRSIGDDLVELDTDVSPAAASEVELLAAHGYRRVTTFTRLGIELDDGVLGPAVPAGVEIRVCGADPTLRRAAHSVKEAAFAGHFGWVPQTYDEWVARHEARSSTDWSQLWLAELHGRPAGMLLANNAFVESDNAGYIQNVGVHPAARGRGLGKALLRTAFAEMRRRGRTKAILGVDTNNTSGALALYESVGMRPLLQREVWRKELTTYR